VIPKVIHFVWIGPPMPDWAKRNIAEFRRLNPEHEIRLHGKEALHPDYRKVYDLADGMLCTQSDLIRYSVLEQFGGWYFDVDYWPFRPVDDIVHAYRLDGEKVLTTEQRGQRNRLLHVTNSVLASAPRAAGWAYVRERIREICVRPSRCGLGPALWTKMVAQRPDLFRVARWSYFCPAPIGDAVPRYQQILAGATPWQALWDRLAETHGQLPFAMHLWLGGRPTLPTYDPAADGVPGDADARRLEGLRVGLTATRAQWLDWEQPFQATAKGLERLGCDVQVAVPEKWPVFHQPRLVVVWNGRKAPYSHIAAGARSAGIPTIVMEHGFFDRRRYSQLDHEGILHWASWRKHLARPAPAEGAARLADVWPHRLRPVRPRQTGYVLVLGQVYGDSQLDESPINHGDHLQKAVAKALPDGLHAVFRPHPRRAKSTAVGPYMPACAAKTLEEAVAGARFAVTINSNSGNEALALGCPVLAFGPALYLAGGVARRARKETLAADLAAMRDGWAPEPGRVTNYLHWLVARQWNVHELASGHVLARLVHQAMGSR